MLFGAHVSVSKGYVHALEYALSVGCECLQLFAKSPRQWRGPAIDVDAAAEFVDARRDVAFGPVYTHTAYLINLATDDAALRERSTEALADELVRGAALHAAGVVTHLGNDPGGDTAAAAQRAGRAIAAAFENAGAAGHETRLLLENTAGAGRTFGGSFEQLSAVIDAADLAPERLGVCLDTCHGFAHGFALDTPEGWVRALDELENAIGLDRLALVHANDCLFERGSRRDRHAWIGDGFIGEAGFEAMICEPRLEGVSAVTEMPGQAPEKDAVNIARLRSLRERCGAGAGQSAVARTTTPL